MSDSKYYTNTHDTQDVVVSGGYIPTKSEAYKTGLCDAAGRAQFHLPERIIGLGRVSVLEENGNAKIIFISSWCDSENRCITIGKSEIPALMDALIRIQHGLTTPSK